MRCSSRATGRSSSARCCSERSISGGTLAKLVREPGGATVVSQLKGTDKSWLVTDQIGSTTALVASNGTVQRTYAYDVDGGDTPSSTGTITTNIKYAGGHDIGNGLYHFGARFYQPSTARWTQMDPLVQPGDLGQANRYTYVGNNPVNNTDPSGLCIILKCSTIKKLGQWELRQLEKLGCDTASCRQKVLSGIGVACLGVGATTYGFPACAGFVVGSELSNSGY